MSSLRAIEPAEYADAVAPLVAAGWVVTEARMDATRCRIRVHGPLGYLQAFADGGGANMLTYCIDELLNNLLPEPSELAMSHLSRRIS